MNICIGYISKTNNTKEVAEYLTKELSNKHNIDLINLDKTKLNQIDKYDLLILGSWIHQANVVKKLSKIINNIQEKHIIVYGTLAADPSSDHGLKTINNMYLLNNYNKIKYCFLLRGLADQSLINQIKFIPPFVATKEQKQMMIDSMLASRKATKQELEQALNQCLNIIEEMENDKC